MFPIDSTLKFFKILFLISCCTPYGVRSWGAFVGLHLQLPWPSLFVSLWVLFSMVGAPRDPQGPSGTPGLRKTETTETTKTTQPSSVYHDVADIYRHQRGYPVQRYIEIWYHRDKYRDNERYRQYWFLKGVKQWCGISFGAMKSTAVHVFFTYYNREACRGWVIPVVALEIAGIGRLWNKLLTFAETSRMQHDATMERARWHLFGSFWTF